ncbi:sulfatase-like hydrolase/transferase, partial [Methylopila musalis]
AIQCESFVDIAARGLPGPTLPAVAALRAGALAFGRCRVPAEGAYTMRSEFGFLTGLPSETLGLDALDPYLTAPAYLGRTLPELFRAAGRATTFLHPYDRRFFDRDVLVPRFGFDRFIDGRAFAEAPRFGPYVADAAVAEALEAAIRDATGPSFLFAVTIENHGPWGLGRLAETHEAAEQYALHLANADRMIGRVAAALAAAPGGGLLCLYGDHAPGRLLHPDLPDRRATDYVLWSTTAPAAPAERRDVSVDELGRMLLAAA